MLLLSGGDGASDVAGGGQSLGDVLTCRNALVLYLYVHMLRNGVVLERHPLAHYLAVLYYGDGTEFETFTITHSSVLTSTIESGRVKAVYHSRLYAPVTTLRSAQHPAGEMTLEEAAAICISKILLSVTSLDQGVEATAAAGLPATRFKGPEVLTACLAGYTSEIYVLRACDVLHRFNPYVFDAEPTVLLSNPLAASLSTPPATNATEIAGRLPRQAASAIAANKLTGIINASRAAREDDAEFSALTGDERDALIAGRLLDEL
jgi:hypothetical protein